MWNRIYFGAQQHVKTGICSLSIRLVHSRRAVSVNQPRALTSLRRACPWSSSSFATTAGSSDNQSAYENVYQRSISNPEAFWAEAAEQISWTKKWSKVLTPPTDSSKNSRWFAGGLLNTCYNALDRHVESGRGDQLALIWDSPVTDSVDQFTYAQLRDKVALFAGVLRDYGAEKGDRVIIYMPMVAEAAVAMLACARLGLIHSVVFGGFSAQELCVRINDARPKLIISASCSLQEHHSKGTALPFKPIVDEAVELATSKPAHCIFFQRKHGPQLGLAFLEGEMKPEVNKRQRDVDWVSAERACLAGSGPAPCVPVLATDPLYILYTSGSTGKPKGVVRDNGGHCVALNWSMKNIWNCQAGDVFWAASDVGWVVGHSYIVYGPLFAGCTSLMYEGKPVGTPDAGSFWRVITQHKVNALFVAPTALRAIRKIDSEGKFLDPYRSKMKTHFKGLFLAGERSDASTLKWAEKMLEVPVIDNYWQTETGWPMAVHCMGLPPILPIVHGSVARPVPGYNVEILDEEGRHVARGTSGYIAVRLPLPPGTLVTVWQQDERYKEMYLARFPGYYTTGDAGFMDKNNYLSVMSRIDDVINVAGHRLSTGEMEEILASHPGVAECAVIGASDAIKGEIPVGLVVLNDAYMSKEGMKDCHDREAAAAKVIRELVLLIRTKIGPVAFFKSCVVVQRLPKTRSGKVLRGVMKKIADAKPYTVPATIEEPAVVAEVTAKLLSIGYPNAESNALGF